MSTLPPMVILAGGRGTRLAAAVPDTPKVLAEVQGRPLLDHLLTGLAAAGFSDLVLGLGFRAEDVAAFAGDGSRWGLRVRCSVEPEPLGTAGALRLASELVDGPFLAMNGDVLIRAPWSELVAAAGPEVLTVLAARVPDTADGGALELEPGGLLLRGFLEKGRRGPGWVNAGVYLCRPALWSWVPPRVAVSLETELVPQLLAAGEPVGAFPSTAVRFLDIGTPDRYAAAEDWTDAP